jgi:hypothetical protein
VQERAQQNFEVSMGISAHEVTLDQLADEIAEVYERCGFDRDATVTTLQMLTNIEVRGTSYDPGRSTSSTLQCHKPFHQTSIC